jgi:hypothetical protein
MANVFKLQATKRVEQRRRETRDRFWPDADKIIWSRKTDHGFCTIPRTLPLIMTLINQLAPKGNGAASRVYFELWCRSFDEGLVEIEDEEDHAFAAGYVGGRAVRSWRERMKLLVDLGFVKVEAKGNRRYAYVLLLHPHDVVETLRKKGPLPKGWYNAYVDRITKTRARMGKGHKSTTAKLG